MSVRFCSFSSGSSGNSYLFASDGAVILIDAGIAGKKISAGLEALGLSYDDVSAILLTHEHSDHVKCVRTVAKRAENAVIYGSPGTLHAVSDYIPSGRERAFICENGKFDIADVTVDPFRLSHDAQEPTGFTLTSHGKSAAFLMDTGFVSDEEFSKIVDADLLVLEANHERNLLLAGPYPYMLKRRILGDHGHLSNEDAAECLIKVIRERTNPEPPKVALAHLSAHNNSPEIAYLSIRNRLYDENMIENRDYTLTVLNRDCPGETVEL
ncbi:MAG: MBL fold metallo-hydrolase [Eubacterium sp.]|jgi:phosphoribosyl 1,2-cyclic phosphodiesterase